MTLSDDPGPLYRDTTTSYGITDYDARSVVTKSGADLAQIEMFLAARGDWSSEKAISNMVFYLQCEDDEIIKINIDQRDGLGEEYTSTEPFDFPEETIDALAAKIGVEEIATLSA